MAFRKRNIALGTSSQDRASDDPKTPALRGVRPSPLTSHSVTSTGAASVDSLLGGHGGLALGSSLLIEESGTTDFAGAVLRYYAAEGICHVHVLHVVGMGEPWVRELPGVAEDRSSARREQVKMDEEKMKIAWRYERLGQAGERARPERPGPTSSLEQSQETTFCHTFDLTKRLSIPNDARVNHLRVGAGPQPFDPIIRQLDQSLKSSPPSTIHRLIVPTILSPALYPSHCSRPENFTRFLHGLRALLRQHDDKLTAMLSLPLDLYPRSTGLIQWAEHLSDGVIELTPFPHLVDASNSLAESGGARSNDEQPQGLVKLHKVPIDTERGEGGAGVGNSIGEDLAFTVSRRKFVVKPFSLPPVEGDQEGQKEGGKLTAKDVEF